MWRASAIVVLLFGAIALADDEPKARYDVPVKRAKDVIVAPREMIDTQLAAEGESIDKALAIVTDKLKVADATRASRLRAAYRLLHPALADDATPDERMNAARRHAAATLLAERDTVERNLLADELAHLEAAKARTQADVVKAPTIELPVDLAWPVWRGKIARRFGAYEHVPSKATLSRRGIDLDVDDRAPVVAPADGTVQYAGPIRGLDNGLVIDHGGYFTVIGKLADPAIPVGTQVHRGDRLGRAARRRVYFEVRIALGPGGIPIDPEAVLVKKPR